MWSWWRSPDTATRRTAVAHRKRGSTCISLSRWTSTTSKNDSRAPKPSGPYSGRPPLQPSSLTIRYFSLRVEGEATWQGLIMVQSISQPTQTQLEQAQQPPPGRLQERTPPRLEHPRPQAQRQQRRQGHHHEQPQRVRGVGHPAALPLEPLALLVPEQLLGPDPFGLPPAQPETGRMRVNRRWK